MGHSSSLQIPQDSFDQAPGLIPKGYFLGRQCANGTDAKSGWAIYQPCNLGKVT